MEILRAMKINYTGVLVLVIISMLRWSYVSAQSNVTGKTESTESKPAATSPPTTLPPNFPKCITSCLDENGFNIPSGDFAYCDDCSAVAKCTYGRIDVLKCPLGTVYYDRVLGVCVQDSTVCINDSYVFASPTGSLLASAETAETASTSTTAIAGTVSPTATAETASTSTTATAETASTSTTAIAETVSPTATAETASTSTTATAETASTSTTATAETSSTSTTSPIPTTVALTSTTTAQSTTSTVQTSQISLSSTAPTTVVETTGSTTNPATATITVSSTTTATSDPTTTGNIPTTGPEAESLLFVLDFYNRFSRDTMRAGVRGIKSVTKQQYQGTNNGTWYRIYGVTMASSSCPNTSENMGADNQKCPPINLISAGSGQSSIMECSFKVNYNIQTNANKQLEMVYMMCYQ